MTSLTLYSDSDYFSPYVLSVFVTLIEKGLPFTLHPIDLGLGANHSPDYAVLSLTSRVPTLVQEGFSLSESTAIIDYLEEAFPTPHYPSVYPQDIQQRAHARQIQAWLRSDLMQIREERPTTTIYVAPSTTPLSAQAELAATKLRAIADRMIDDASLTLFGAWCIADTDLALMLNRLVANGDPVSERIRRYVAHQFARPSVQRWVALSDAVRQTRI